jgi:DNA anti-recombination protein RmuC
MRTEFQVVEDRPELIRDPYSKGITNRDTSAYTNYMNGAHKRKSRQEKLDETVEEINTIKQEMSEMKDMLRQLLENKSNGN